MYKKKWKVSFQQALHTVPGRVHVCHIIMPLNMAIWLPGWLEKMAGVVGPDQGPTPSNLSSCSLLQQRRERERESLVDTKFFLHSTPQCEQQNDKVSGVVAIFSVSTYLLIVYVTSMNIVHYL